MIVPFAEATPALLWRADAIYAVNPNDLDRWPLLYHSNRVPAATVGPAHSVLAVHVTIGSEAELRDVAERVLAAKSSLEPDGWALLMS